MKAITTKSNVPGKASPYSPYKIKPNYTDFPEVCSAVQKICTDIDVSRNSVHQKF